MAGEYWKINDRSRAHIVLGQIIDKGGYHYKWTEKTIEKLVYFGLAELADAPSAWGWGKAKQVIVTHAGEEAFYGAQRAGFVNIYPPREDVARRKAGA